MSDGSRCSTISCIGGISIADLDTGHDVWRLIYTSAFDAFGTPFRPGVPFNSFCNRWIGGASVGMLNPSRFHNACRCLNYWWQNMRSLRALATKTASSNEGNGHDQPPRRLASRRSACRVEEESKGRARPHCGSGVNLARLSQLAVKHPSNGRISGGVVPQGRRPRMDGDYAIGMPSVVILGGGWSGKLILSR